MAGARQEFPIEQQLRKDIQDAQRARDQVGQEVKKRQQAIPYYEQGGRSDLAEKERRESDILQAYLQASQLSEDDLRAVVARLIDEHGREFKRVMPLAAKETKGRANGARVQQIV